MTTHTHSFNWLRYLRAAVGVYVLAALASSILIGVAAYVADPAEHSDAWSILGPALLAATPLLVIGIPMSVALSVLLRWIHRDRRISWVIPVAMSLVAGFLALLILMNFHVEQITPQSLAYLLPWALFGPAYVLAVPALARGGSPVDRRVTFTDAD